MRSESVGDRVQWKTDLFSAGKGSGHKKLLLE